MDRDGVPVGVGEGERPPDLGAASAAGLAVQTTMCAGLTPARQQALLDVLAVCIRNLGDGS